MKKILPLSLSGLVAVTLWMPITSVNAAGTSMEQRVQRLERMTENPVLLQLSQRLGEQQREIQELHDLIDRLKRDFRNADHKSDKRYKETDDRLSFLESGSVVNEQSSSTVKPNLELPVKSFEIEPEISAQAGQVSNSKVALPLTTGDNSLAVSGAMTQKIVVGEPGSQALAGSTFKESIVDESSNTQTKLQEGSEPVENKVDQIVVGPIKTVPATELEKDKYQQAFAQMKAAQYDAATNAFEQFLSAYPQSELASNAAYWAGEGHLIKKQNQVALDSFMIVIERYPNAPKIADAQLRAADSLANLNRIEDAKKMYQNVINGRPHSRSAQTASKRLNGLK
jgi:tol-pal system protein YbgF